MNDLFTPVRSPARKSSWRLWHGAVDPCYCKLLAAGEPRLVGLYFRTRSVTRVIVRLEWRDGQHWIREAKDAPWHIHELGEDSSREWANLICEKIAIEWCCDEIHCELVDRRAA